MIPQYQHDVTTSFLLWFDHHLLQKGAAYSNTTGTFYHLADPLIPTEYTPFSSPYRQIVNNSDITGATIPSGAWINGSFSGRSNGVVVDFQNARVLISGAPTTGVVTGSFAVKDFNIYYTANSEEDLIIDKKYIANPRKGYSAPNSGMAPYDAATPVIFISNETTRNKPFAFGGMDTSEIRMKAVIFADDVYQLDGVLSIFADSVNSVIPLVPFSGDPTTELGDVKGGSYSFAAVSGLASSHLFIDDVVSSKLQAKDSRAVANNLFVGFLDFDICQQRYPRV